MVLGDGRPKTATLNTDINVTLNGERVAIRAFLIGGNNFIRLRDIMRMFDIAVTYDPATRNIGIDTSKPYLD